MMIRAGHVAYLGETGNACRILAPKPERKRLFMKLRHT
jgi:hypothetical protein